MHALVLDGRVVDVAPEPFDVADPLAWIEAGDDVRPGWTVDNGGQPTAPVEEDPADLVPASITPLQARKGLRAWGIGKAEIAGFFASIPDEDAREDAEDAWEYATEIQRANPLIAGCAAFLEKSDADVDQFFRDAAAL